MRSRVVTPALLLATLGLTACGGQSPAPQQSASAAGTRPQVQAVAAFYPLEFVLSRVGGERVEVEGLTPPGAEPHDLELGVRQAARVSDADLLVHLRGFQPAVDEAAAGLADKAFDVTAAVELLDGYAEIEHEGEHAAEGEGEGEGQDPHVWLDPTRLATIGEAVAERLTKADPEGAGTYRDGAAALTTDLTALDEEFRRGLRTCDRREIVVSHNAFGYLADRYTLKQVGISGLSPEEEPSAARVVEAARYAKAHKVTTIFFETLVNPAVAQTVADEVGARTAVLDPVEGQPEGGDYLTAMRGNLRTLRSELGCA